MQYILTEEEYNDLKKQIEEEKKKNYDLILELCQKCCDNIPITLDWGIWSDKPTPWECIRSMEMEDVEWYCDHCPVQKECPYEHKNWSK